MENIFLQEGERMPKNNNGRRDDRLEAASLFRLKSTCDERHIGLQRLIDEKFASLNKNITIGFSVASLVIVTVQFLLSFR